MSSNWPIVRLGDHVDSSLGKMLDKNKNKGMEQLYLGNSDVRWGYFDLTDLSMMRFEHQESDRYGIRRGDLIVCEGGEPGRCAIWKDELPDMRIQKALHRVRTKSSLDNYYLYYWFLYSGHRGTLEPYFTGTTIKHLTGKALKDLEIQLPPKQYQEWAAKILKSLDDKIELNRQTNQTLEQIAQALFKSWFVDFEPTRAKLKAKQEWAKLNPTTKAAGNDQNAETLFVERAAMAAISGKALHELDHLDSEQLAQLKLTAGLFPDGFEESELGEVPVGWEVGELQCIAEFSTDRISVSELTLNNYISTENMLERKQGVSFATSLPSVKTVPHFSANQILISNIRPYFMKIWLTRFEGGRSNDVLGIKARDTGSVEYLYNLLYQDSFFGFMMTTSKGAKMPRGDKKAIMGWMCVHPPKEVKRMYSLAVDKFYQIIDSANKENENLKNIRNTLLPKLLSGELSLEQFQTELETA